MLFDIKGFGDKVALVEGERSCTYRELDEISSGIASAAGDARLAFLLCENHIEAIAGYLAFVNNGIVPMLLDAEIDGALLCNLMELYRPELIWKPESRDVDLAGASRLLECGSYALFDRGVADPYELNPGLTLLMSTSGSTGTSKLVRLSQDNIVSNTEAIIEYLGITSEDRAITSLPMSYVYGLSVIQTHLAAGATLVLTDSACYEGRFWKLFDKERCTSFAGVPFMYEMLDKLRFAKKVPPATLKTMTQAGGHLSVALQEKFARWAKEYGIDFFVMYGASEATARMGYLPPDRSLDKIGSAGIAIPGGCFEIAGKDGIPLGIGEIGELAYRGPNVSMGYATCGEDLAKGDENNGYLLTGDMARMDDEGFVYIVGRKKRFVKILGKRTNLEEVEELIKAHLGVTDVACGGHDDLLRVFLVDAALSEAAKAFVHEKMGINEKLVDTVIVDEILKNASGKTLYAELDRIAEEGAGDGAR